MEDIKITWDEDIEKGGFVCGCGNRVKDENGLLFDCVDFEKNRILCGNCGRMIAFYDIPKGKGKSAKRVNPTVGMYLSELIKRKRITLGLSTGELAERVGCSNRIIEMWERGDRIPRDIGLLDKVLKELGESYTIGINKE